MSWYALHISIDLCEPTARIEWPWLMRGKRT